MPRGLERRYGLGHHHFVTFSCYRREPYFAEASTREVFEASLEAMRRKYRFSIDSYVVMPEHVHLGVSEPPVATLSVALQALKISVSRRSLPRPFWQRRFYDFNVYTDEKRLEKRRYMHRNPVIRGLVKHPGDWAWSSYRHWATGQDGVVEIESPWTFARRMAMADGMGSSPDILQTHISESRCGAPSSDKKEDS
jgi:putative transposase